MNAYGDILIGPFKEACDVKAWLLDLLLFILIQSMVISYIMYEICFVAYGSLTL